MLNILQILHDLSIEWYNYDVTPATDGFGRNLIKFNEIVKGSTKPTLMYVMGSAGTGKSTFIDYIVKKHKHENETKYKLYVFARDIAHLSKLYSEDKPVYKYIFDPKYNEHTNTITSFIATWINMLKPGDGPLEQNLIICDGVNFKFNDRIDIVNVKDDVLQLSHTRELAFYPTAHIFNVESFCKLVCEENRRYIYDVLTEIKFKYNDTINTFKELVQHLHENASTDTAALYKFLLDLLILERGKPKYVLVWSGLQINKDDVIQQISQKILNNEFNYVPPKQLNVAETLNVTETTNVTDATNVTETLYEEFVQRTKQLSQIHTYTHFHNNSTPLVLFVLKFLNQINTTIKIQNIVTLKKTATSDIGALYLECNLDNPPLYHDRLVNGGHITLDMKYVGGAGELHKLKHRTHLIKDTYCLTSPVIAEFNLAWTLLTPQNVQDKYKLNEYPRMESVQTTTSGKQKQQPRGQKHDQQPRGQKQQPQGQEQQIQKHNKQLRGQEPQIQKHDQQPQGQEQQELRGLINEFTTPMQHKTHQHKTIIQPKPDKNDDDDDEAVKVLKGGNKLKVFSFSNKLKFI